MSRLRDAGTSINSPYNQDTLKHKSAAALARSLQQRVIAKVYDRVLIVVNRDMARAIASTVERFALQHYILGLLPGCTDCYNCNCWGGNRKRSARERNQLKTPPSWRGKKGGATQGNLTIGGPGGPRYLRCGLPFRLVVTRAALRSRPLAANFIPGRRCSC